MKTCERKHKKTKYEEEIDLRILTDAGVGSTCDGEIEKVMSADGKRQYGERCSRCGHVTHLCQFCENLFAKIEKHFENAPQCRVKNPEYTRMRAIEDNAKGRPK